MSTASKIFKFLRSVPGSSASFGDGSPSHFRDIQRDLIQVISPQRDKVNYKKTINLSKVKDLLWWIQAMADGYSSKSRFINFVRCFRDCMGSSPSRIPHRRSLERARSPGPYKLLGAGSSISDSPSFFVFSKGESCPVWAGQLHYSSVYQPARRYNTSTPHSIVFLEKQPRQTI